MPYFAAEQLFILASPLHVINCNIKYYKIQEVENMDKRVCFALISCLLAVSGIAFAASTVQEDSQVPLGAGLLIIAAVLVSFVFAKFSKKRRPGYERYRFVPGKGEMMKLSVLLLAGFLLILIPAFVLLAINGNAVLSDTMKLEMGVATIAGIGAMLAYVKREKGFMRKNTFRFERIKKKLREDDYEE